VFSHGWPLSSDDWDAQMLFFLNHGYRVVAHDRCGHGRSAQVADGHDMDYYAGDLAALTAPRSEERAPCRSFNGRRRGGALPGSTRREQAAKAVLVASVPPLMVKTEANPGGPPKEVFDGFQVQVATNRSQLYRDLAAGPFCGYNRPGRQAIRGGDPKLVAAGQDGRR
jgi:non-heme chloroperoxidase